MTDKRGEKRKSSRPGRLVKSLRRAARSGTGRQDLFVLLLAIILAFVLGSKARLGPYRFFLVVCLGASVASVDWLFRGYWKIKSNLAVLCRFAIQTFGITGLMIFVMKVFQSPKGGLVYLCAYGAGGILTKILVPKPKKKRSTEVDPLTGS